MKSKNVFIKSISVFLCMVMVLSVIPLGVIGISAETESAVLLELGSKAYSGWSAGTTDEYTVETNKTNGDITIVFTPKNNNWQTEGKNLLSVNGVSIVSTCGTNGNAGYSLGKTAVKTWNTNTITVVITPYTGAAVISDSAGNTGTANVGVIGDSFTMVVNADNHNSWTLTGIVVTQVNGASGGSSDVDELYANSFDSSADVARGTCGDATNVAFNEEKSALRISHNNWNYSKAYWETSVNLNGSNGIITLKTTIDVEASNPPATSGADGNILTVNGIAVIKNTNGGRVVTLGGKTDVKGCAGGFKEEVTLVIDPITGIASLTFEQDEAHAKDASFPKTTVVEEIELGTIGDALSIRYGSNRHPDFYVYSLKVEQVSGEAHTCEYTATVKEATCTTPEFTVKACSECGVSIEAIISPVLGHTWGAWEKVDGASVRSCSACGETEAKTVFAIDKTKSLVVIGDSLAYGLNLSNTVNGSWAKKVSDSLGMASYSNLALSGSETYQWYSVLTGKAAPNGKTTESINGLTKADLISAIEKAGVVAISLESNDMIGGYVAFRSAQQVSDTLCAIVDEIHTVNPDAVVVLVGYAYGVSMIPGGEYEDSYQLFIDFNELMTEAINSGSYNDYAHYIDVSDTMSNTTLLGADKVHPTTEGHKKIADRVISALGYIDVNEEGELPSDTVTWENVTSYVNHFDGTAPAASVVSWGATGTNGVLEVAPSTNKNENQLGVGAVAFPAKTIITFKFNIPQLPESGSINIFHDRTLSQNYICVFSKVNEETQEMEFWATVGNKNEGNSAIKVEENTWYDVTILFAENASSYSRVYVGNTFVGTVAGNTIGRNAGWGFANFSGCSGSGEQNAATYLIDDFTASTVADDTLVHAYGIQRTEALEMKYDVRFIFTVNDIYSGESAIGMDVTVNYDGESSTKTGYETNCVFEQIYESYGENTITASMLGGKYIAAIVVEDIPADYEEVEFIISPYAVINGVKFYSKTMTATVYSAK